MSERFLAALVLLLILSTATFAADKTPPVAPSARVRAKVLYGTDDEKQQRADIELWISQAVARKGAPLAQPHSDWIDLTENVQTLHSANGIVVSGKATETEDQFEVTIEGCDGFSLDQLITLKQGERKVLKLTDYPAPHNTFIALEAPVSEQSKKRAESLKANAKTFRLELNYNGEQGKPFYQMIVSVPVIQRLRDSPFERIVQINQNEAINLIDHLAREGFLDKAEDLVNDVKISVFPPNMPGYAMTVLPFYEDLGWGLPMIHRLDRLRNALPENGTKDMDLLLERMSGWRKKWEAEHPPLIATVGGEKGGIRFVTKDDVTIIDITSEFGIGKATIKRESPKWPKTMLVHLHLKGLELFNIGNGEVGVDWSFSSTGENTSRVFLRSGADETALDGKSPYCTEARMVGGNGKIPLQDGYFEVPLPAKLFERNPEEITLQWIDFYRN